MSCWFQSKIYILEFTFIIYNNSITYWFYILHKFKIFLEPFPGKFHCDLNISCSQEKNYENFADNILKTKANNKCFIVLKYIEKHSKP